MESWAVANSVTSFATIFAGVITLTLGELVLISNSILGTFLLGLRIKMAPARCRPYYWITVAWFILGMLAATASNRQVDFGFMAWHALWHIIGAFGFVMLWAYTDARYHLNLSR